MKKHIPFKDYSKVFNPSRPVKLTEFFVGRDNELFTLRNAIKRSGQHALIFGERGIGKTCLAEIALRGQKDTIVKLQCGNKWTFVDFSHQLLSSLGKHPRALEIQTLKENVKSPGLDVKIVKLGSDHKKSEKRIEKGIANKKWDASSLIYELRNNCKPTIVVLDEYDLLPKKSDFHKQISFFLKGVSNDPDRIPLTLVIIGIATTAHELLAGHKSSGRNLQEVFLKYIKRSAMRDFLSKAEHLLQISFEQNVFHKLVTSTRGYPYYIHLICENIMDAVTIEEPKRRCINNKFYKMGLARAVESKYQDLKDKYGVELSRISGQTEILLKRLCLYHDQDIRETEQAEKVVVGNGHLDQHAFTKAIESINRSVLPIKLRARYIQVRDPMFLLFLQKYYWGQDPPVVEGLEQGLLF